MRVDNVPALGDGQISEVLALVATASHLDGVAPLSEQSLLAVRGGDKAGATTGSPHFLAYAGAHLAGYAHLERGGAGEAVTGEVVVDPAHRRQGVGTALIHALETAPALEIAPEHALETAPETAPDPEGESEAEAGTLQLWSHGHLDAARAFAVRDGYSSVRELWAMRRSLRSDVDPLPDVRLPEGFSARHFVIGQDEDAWLRVNARAFADHPEQGRLTRHDLDRRIAEPWFDARGFILIEDTRGFAPVLAASHWTKVVPAEHPEVGPTAGEVYVVGVDPAYQGLGLGRVVTILGLAYLRGRGLTEATLYVDADNSAAIAVYSRLGFARFAADVMYSPAVHPPVTR
jgi:mycothiol synthase